MNPQQFMAVPQPTTSGIVWTSIGMAILLGVSIFLGLLGKRQWKTFDEYLVGKRDIGPAVTGFAFAASAISGWAFCGSTGIVYTIGFSGMWFAGIWSLVGQIPCAWLAAVKTREFSMKLGAATLSETLGRRFESKGLQTVVALSMLMFLFLYSIGQLKAGAGVWYAVTGLPPFWCLILSVFIVYLYIVFGGYIGNQWAMAFQGAFLGLVGLVLGVAAIVWAGGFHNITASLYAQNPALIKLMRPDLPTTGATELFSSLVGIIATPVIFFTMLIGFPHNVSRFLGMGKLKKRDFWVLVICIFAVTGIPVMLDCSSNGLVARMMYGPQLLKIEPWKGDLAAPMLAYGAGGKFLLSFYVMGLFAAALSTLAGMVFIMSANVTKDVIKLWRPQTSDKSMLYFGHFLLAVFIFAPFYWTLVNPPPLLSVFMGLAAMGMGAIFFLITTISYYWKRATKWGAILTVLYGTILTPIGGHLVFVPIE